MIPANGPEALLSVVKRIISRLVVAETYGFLHDSIIYAFQSKLPFRGCTSWRAPDGEVVYKHSQLISWNQYDITPYIIMIDYHMVREGLGHACAVMSAW